MVGAGIDGCGRASVGRCLDGWRLGGWGGLAPVPAAGQVGAPRGRRRAPGHGRDRRGRAGAGWAVRAPARPAALAERARRGRRDGGFRDGRGRGGHAAARPGRPEAQQGDARLDVVRRRRGSVRARLARRQLVRHDERHLLDAQSEGIRRPAQARTGIPGAGTPRDSTGGGPGRPPTRPTPADAGADPADARDPQADAQLPTADTASRRPRPTHTTSSWWESTTGATGPEPGPSAAAVRREPRRGPAFARPADAGPRRRHAAARHRPCPRRHRPCPDRPDLRWRPRPHRPGVPRLAADRLRCLVARRRDHRLRPVRGDMHGTGGPDRPRPPGRRAPRPARPSRRSRRSRRWEPSRCSAPRSSAAFVLSATGEAADGDSRRVALGAVLLVSWLAGIAIAVARRVRTPASTTRPVS